MANLVFTKVLENNIWSVSPSVSSISAADLLLVTDYGEPRVAFGGVIDVTATTLPMLVSGLSGDFTVGEIITGGVSAATATVFYYDAVSTTLYVTNRSVANFQAETITGGTSGTTATGAATGTAITKFEARYDYAPESTVNFSIASLVRYIPSTLNTTTVTFNGNLNVEAEVNAKDLIVTLRKLVKESWDALVAHSNTFEGTETYPL
jgi:hypothetical protein